MSKEQEFNEKRERFVTLLRESRIKYVTDYAFVGKYDEFHILCHHVWKEAILEVAKTVGLTITSIHTYEFQPKVLN